jgi:microcystin-dependent protein
MLMNVNRFLAGLCVALCLATGASAATLLPPARQTFINGNGAPLAGGSITFYVPGTTTLKDTWGDAGQTILNSNPLLLDANGSATIYGTGSYREVVKDRNGVLLWDKITSDTSSAGSVSWGGVSTGAANAQQVSAPNFTSLDGQSISFVAGFTNTGPMSLNPSGAGPINVVNDTPAGPVNLGAGDIVTGNVIDVTYSTLSGTFHTKIIPPTVPAGTVTEFAGNSPPSGYLLADGSAVSRSTYSRLYAVIGTVYGSGDGSSTFNVPDHRGRAGVGVDTAGRLSFIPVMGTLGGTGGEQAHTLALTELPPITPTGTVTVSYPPQSYSYPNTPIGVSAGAPNNVWSATTTTGSTGGASSQTFSLAMNSFGNGTPHNVVQPSIAINFIIKY